MQRSAKVSKARKRSAKRPSAKVREAAEAAKVTLGPPKFTRFERARIIGARSLQLALGAPPFIPVNASVRDPIALAMTELERKALPISIRRTLPDGRYQDISVDMLL